MAKDSDREIVYKKTDELIPYAKNSRTHSAEQVLQIASSIKEFGFTNPVLIDPSGSIIAGHGRVMAAKKISMSTVPCIVLDYMSEAQKKAYVIADNKMALNAGWDDSILKLELEELKELQFDLSLTGFSKDEINSLTKERKKLTDEDSVPEEPDIPFSKKGDVFILGDHRVMCGDSTSKADVDKLMDGKKCDLVWTDPPYNVAIDGKAGKILNDDMSDQKFKDFLFEVYTRFYEQMKPGACIYVAHADSERVNFTSEFVRANIKLSQVLIWVKNAATLSRQDYNWQHEPILYGWKEGAGHYFCENYKLTSCIDDEVDPEKMKKEELVDLVKKIRSYPSTVIRFDRPTRSDLHPTMKPVSLVERMITWSSKENEIVLDLFGGSGSTLIACENSDRKARLMELDPKFCDVIVKRWEEYTGKKAILESNLKELKDGCAKENGPEKN